MFLFITGMWHMSFATSLVISYCTSYALGWGRHVPNEENERESIVWRKSQPQQSLLDWFRGEQYISQGGGFTHRPWQYTATRLQDGKGRAILRKKWDLHYRPSHIKCIYLNKSIRKSIGETSRLTVIEKPWIRDKQVKICTDKYKQVNTETFGWVWSTHAGFNLLQSCSELVNISRRTGRLDIFTALLFTRLAQFRQLRPQHIHRGRDARLSAHYREAGLILIRLRTQRKWGGDIWSEQSQLLPNSGGINKIKGNACTSYDV